MAAPNLTPRPSASSGHGPLASLMRAVGRMGCVDPVVRGLRRHREDRAADELALRLTAARGLEAGVLAHDRDASVAFDALCNDAVESVRRARPPGPRAWLHATDRVLYTPGHELMDDADFPESERRHTLASLDTLNERLGNYARWARAVDALTARALGRPVRVVDLAAGHGGFAVALKTHFGDRAEVWATDLRDEYLTLGRVEARARGLDVHFVACDATDLAPLAAASVDLFVCTQSLHHFSPGMVARMLGEAARCARLGAWFVDGERGPLSLAFASTTMAFIGRRWPVVHDTFVSVRRMFSAEELALLGHLAPGLPAGSVVSAGREGPAYAYVAVTRDPSPRPSGGGPP